VVETAGRAGGGCGEPLGMVSQDVAGGNGLVLSRVPEPSVGREVDPEAAALAHNALRRSERATAEDVEWLRGQVERLPLPLLRELDAAGVRFVAARDSVLEVHPELAGVRIGLGDVTMGDFVALYNPPNRKVTVAVGQLTGPEATPEAREEADIVVAHEAAHAFETIESGRGRGHTDPRFVAARDEDYGRLNDYLRIPGTRGAQETYAEGFRRYLAGDRASMPAIYDYFDCIRARRCRKPRD
jgi:hypothetical protein